MSRLLIAGIVVAAVLTVYAVIDAAMTDPKRTRALSKPVWLIVALCVPVVGPILWILFGKGLMLKSSPAAQSAPDDDESFLRSLGDDAAHNDRIRQLEAELAALDEQFDRPATPRADDASPARPATEAAAEPAPTDASADEPHAADMTRDERDADGDTPNGASGQARA